MSVKEILGLTQRPSLFWTPDYLDISAWIEHVPFAFFLVDVLRPKTIVELGVHNGTSFFAFCQAVNTLNIDCTCYGIDAWKGDEHAGFYDDAVYQKVIKYNAEHYTRFSSLLRSTFDEALQYFVDDSVELLHIDGLHTYEAVKYDFETWRPKLKKDAFVIFHDINVRERQFGVFRLWEELKSQYEHLQFDFGYGLGVICLDNIKNETLASLFADNNTHHVFLRNLFSDRGNLFKLKLEHTLLQKEKEQQELSLRQAHNDLNANYKTLESHYFLLIDTRETLGQENARLNENIKGIEAECSQLKEIKQSLEAENRQLQEGYEKISQNYNQIAETNTSFTESNKILNEQIRVIQLQNSHLNETLSLQDIQQQQLKDAHEKLDLSNKALIEKYQDDFEKMQDRISQLTTKNDILGTAKSELDIIVEQRNKTIAWYKSTYEDRSILGTVKQKIKDRYKKNEEQR
ncbi:MAG: class I SAM-dependent methyltransferase [Chitinophagaceae bacterium]